MVKKHKRKKKVQEQGKKKLKTIKAKYKPKFEKEVKYIYGQDRVALALLENDLNDIKTNPYIGASKKGKLRGIRVHKVKRGTDSLLIAYKFDKKERILEFFNIGSHENFYRDLEKYV